MDSTQIYASFLLHALITLLISLLSSPDHLAVASSFSEKSLRHTISAGSGDAHPHSKHQQRISAGTARLISNKQRSSPPPLLVVAEPRYMRDMTTAIMRIAVFHLCCWLPYCVLQMVPLLLQYRKFFFLVFSIIIFLYQPGTSLHFLTFIPSYSFHVFLQFYSTVPYFGIFHHYICFIFHFHSF